MGEAIGHVLGGDIYIPYAIDVDGQIITIFDPVTHESRREDDETPVIRADAAIDRRWIKVSRPVMGVNMRTHSNRRQSLIEFSLVLPLLLVTVPGVVEVSYALLDQHLVTKLTREGST